MNHCGGPYGHVLTKYEMEEMHGDCKGVRVEIVRRENFFQETWYVETQLWQDGKQLIWGGYTLRCGSKKDAVETEGYAKKYIQELQKEWPRIEQERRKKEAFRAACRARSKAAAAGEASGGE